MLRAGLVLVVVTLAGCGSAADPGAPPVVTLAPAAQPDWSTEFAGEGGQWEVNLRSGGSVAFGGSDARASDNAVATLTLPGDASLQPGEKVGPGFATEIASRERFLYGTFRTRVQLARCRGDRNEEVVNGIFTYFNDGSDRNGNGIADNSELDIEVLCSKPYILSLTSWTDYEAQPERFRKWSRVIDFSTGEYQESVNDHEYDLGPRIGRPEFRRPGFPDPDAFYEVGVEWHASRLRFFMVLDGAELTLWDFADARLIPQRPSNLLFNVWHPRDHWFGPAGDADYPAGDASMRLDWARYWRE